MHFYVQSAGKHVRAEIIHVEANGSNFLKLFYDRGMYELSVDSAAAGYRTISEVKDDFRRLPSIFPEVTFPVFTDEDAEGWLAYPNWIRLESEGFLNPMLNQNRAKAIEMLKGTVEWPEIETLDPLSRGNFIASLFEDPTYLPTSENEVNFIWDYLANVERWGWGYRKPNSNFTVGYFGNFKYILKSLTERFEHLLEASKPHDIVPALAGCLGSGYGHVDAYLSKGFLMPLDKMWDGYYNRNISELPEFGGRAYPSLATAQYLSRKGTRLLELIEQRCQPIVTTRFKINALNAADLLDEKSTKFSNYQILVNKIIFADSSEKLASGRKVVTPSQVDFEVLAKNFTSKMGKDESDLVTKWIEGMDGNNPIVTKFAFEASQEVGATFPLKRNSVRALSLSSSLRAQAYLMTYISANTNNFLWLDESTWANFIANSSDETIRSIISSNNYGRRSIFVQWVNYCQEKALTEREIQISKLILTEGLANGNHLLPKFLIKLAETTQFEPFAEWQGLVSLRNRLWGVSTGEFLRFIGVDPAVPGIFTYIKTPNRALCEIYAEEIASTLYWNETWTWGTEQNQTQVNRSLEKLLNSGDENLKTVALVIISKKLITQGQLNNFYGVLNDPKIQFEILRDAVLTNDESAILGLVSDLSKEEKRTFWRMFAAETQQMFEQWPSFPKFFWANINQLPTFLVELFANYGWLAVRVRKEISPSSVSKLNAGQAIYFVRALKEQLQFLEDKSLVRALLTAPDAQINQFGASFVEQSGQFAEYWLVMLESNLPVPSKAAVSYLESQISAKDFEEQLMKALDSNNEFARSAALRILNSANSPKLLAGVVQKLAENRNKDTWGVVAKNLNLIEEAKNLHTFTRRVFLSRRKARAQKEQVKDKISSLVRSISEVVEQDLLVRMSLGSVAKDRDWALREIAQGGLDLEGVTVEFTWKAGSNV